MRYRCPWRWVRAAALLIASLGPVSCGCTGDSGSGTVAPAVPPLFVGGFQPNPVVAFQPVPFDLVGNGFARGVPKPSVGGPAGLATVTVTFIANDGTPFGNGTSAEAQVVGTVVSDTLIQGVTPRTDQPGGWTASVKVADSVGTGTSAAPISTFVGLTVFAIDEHEIPADTATPFEVTGLSFLPVGGQATVRFTSLIAVFAGGSNTLDVIVDVINPTRVSGVTPAFPLGQTVPTYVSVILHQEPGAPEATSYSALTLFTPPPPVPVVVSTISPPMPIDVATTFTITGSGFLGAGGDPDVAVTFTAPGHPFRGGTAVEITVPATAMADDTIVGTSPEGTSATDFTAFVTVTRSDGISGTSATDIALFLAPPSSVDTFTPRVMPSDVATPFGITGANLPSGQMAVVRFRAQAGTPFAGGTSATADVPASVTSATHIDGFSPVSLTADPFLCEVDVILQSKTELNMGPQCLFEPPATPPPSNCVVTNLDDSGPGSLRDRILNAPPGCIITFDPALSGDLNLVSTLQVPHDVHVLGPGADVIRVTAQRRDFPVFTVQAGAPDTVISLLTIAGSRHDGDGGGFVVLGGLTLVRCVVTDHGISDRGACVYVDGGTLSLKECTLVDNRAGDRGGAVFAGDGSTIEVVGCTFQSNEAEAGGGVASLDPSGTIRFENCTLFDNHASGGPGGGAVLVMPGTTVEMLHCTVTDNHTHGQGGGVLIQSGTLVATSCIFSRNADGRGDPEVANKNGTNVTTFSLLRVGTGSGLTNGVGGNLVGTENAPIDPKLKALQENGGPTKTQMPVSGGPVVDVALVGACTPTDQRGVNRPIGGGCDMGACEADVSLL